MDQETQIFHGKRFKILTSFILLLSRCIHFAMLHQAYAMNFILILFTLLLCGILVSGSLCYEHVYSVLASLIKFSPDLTHFWLSNIYFFCMLIFFVCILFPRTASSDDLNFYYLILITFQSKFAEIVACWILKGHTRDAQKGIVGP